MIRLFLTVIIIFLLIILLCGTKENGYADVNIYDSGGDQRHSSVFSQCDQGAC